MSENKENLYTRDGLLGLGIYELRDLGRDIGVPSPTTLKKEALVDMILSIIYGESPTRRVGKGRGRPVRAKEKPNKLFIDLIDKLEAPKCESTFIYGNSSEIAYSTDDLLTTKVASSCSPYINDCEKESEQSPLKQGVVCIEDGKYYVRKFKFIKSETDIEIPACVVKDYGLIENDVVQVLINLNDGTFIQLFKVNDHLAEKKAKFDEIIEVGGNKELYVEESKIVLGQSNIIYVPTVQDRSRIVDSVSKTLENMGYNTVKVCFDRNEAVKSENFGIAKSEIFASCIGDEFETMAMVETGIEKAVFYNMLGNKSVLIIDNLKWLLSVIETYPSTIYGNFVEKMVKTCKNSNVTLVCVTSHLSNETVKELSNYFENINM